MPASIPLDEVAALGFGDCPYRTGASITVDGGLTLGLCAAWQEL